MSFTDADGDKYTVALLGAGTQTVTQDGDGGGPIAQISLQNTNATSKLVVSVTKVAGGDGRVSIGSINSSSGLLGISAPASDLVGAGINVTGFLGSVRVRDVAGAIQAGGSATQRTSVFGHVFQDGSTINLGSSIAILQAATIGTTTIQTPTIGVLKVVGDATNKVDGVLEPIAGDFAGSLTLSGSGSASKPISLSLAIVSGSLGGSNWQVTGDVGSVIVNRLVDGWNFNGTGKIAALRLGEVFSANVTATGSIGSVFAKHWDSGALTAATLGTLTVPGIPTAVIDGIPSPIPGDFNVNLTLSGSGNPLKPGSLARATVAGSVGGTWQITGNVGPVSAKGPISSWAFNGSGNVLGLTLGTVDFATVQATGKINTVSAKGWGSGHLNAASINVLTIAGDLGAAVTLSGQGVATNTPTLNTAIITGAVSGSTVTVTGILNTFTAMAMLDSLVLVGYIPNDPDDPIGGGGTFSTTTSTGGKINNLKITGVTDAFINSTIGAETLGTVSLASVLGDNGGEAFGVVANATILGVSVKSPAFTFNKTAATPQGFADFQVVLIPT